MSGTKEWSNDTWSVTTHKAPILDTNELDQLESRIGIPMPEMVFGKNKLVITHKPSTFSVQFTAESALDEVDKTFGEKTKILQVAHSDKWKASKIKHKQEVPPAPGQIDYDVNKIHRPFDWTYTTPYQGSIAPQAPTPQEEGIPYDELKKPEPILFFDEVQLYEDELGDFGLTTYTAKIRVMPRNLFVLARLYVRVDNVAFRIRDTRVYVDFETGKITREYTEKESAFDYVRKRVPIWAEDFTQLLRDPNWIDSVAEPVKKEISGVHVQ